MPEFRVEFYPFANVNNTIRLRDGVIHVRISDLLEGAPESVIEAIAHILLAKMYRKPIESAHATRLSPLRLQPRHHDQGHLVRQMRGRKRIESPRGIRLRPRTIFETLNRAFFLRAAGASADDVEPASHARNSLAHYDPAHNAIVVSRIFDHLRVPRYAVEYIVYHEMLHLKHPVKLRGSRRCVHGPEFQAEEKLFPELEKAKAFLKQL